MQGVLSEEGEEIMAAGHFSRSNRGRNLIIPLCDIK